MQYQELQNLIPAYEVITFDVFDTLILRDVLNSRSVFQLVEKIYDREKNVRSNFYQKRIQAEKIARHSYPYREVSLDEIYKVLGRYYPAEECRMLHQMEISTELKVCKANQEMLPCYEYALQQQKQIYIITDMYLPKSVIAQILEENGYKNYEDILVSGDFHKTKADGILFALFLEKYAISPKKVLHIGDSRKADYIQAKQHGMDAFLYSKPGQYFEHCKPSFLDRIKKNEYANLCSFIKNHLISKKQNYYYQCGFALFGPLLFGYIKWLIRQCQKEKVQEILFLSRDGYILQKVYNAVSGNIPNTYFYASRKAVIKGLLHYDASLEQTVNRYKSWPYQFSFRLFLDKIGITVQEAAALGCTEFDTLFTKEQFLTNTVLHQQFLQIKPTLDQKSLLAEKNLLSYCKMQQIKDKNVALVDLGGRQTIAKNLQEFLQKNHIPVHLYGNYLEIQDSASAHADGYLFSRGKNQNIYRTLSSYYYFLEIILSAPHGSVSGYEQSGKQIMPVLEKYDYQSGDAEPDILQFLQAGVLDFCREFKENMSLYDMAPDTAIRSLKEFGITPTKEDIAHWKDFRFNMDVLCPLIQPLTLAQIFKNPGIFVKQYKTSLWKAGLLTEIFHTSGFNDVFEMMKRLIKY